MYVYNPQWMIINFLFEKLRAFVAIVVFVCSGEDSFF